MTYRPSSVAKARHGASVTAHDSLKEMGSHAAYAATICYQYLVTCVSTISMNWINEPVHAVEMLDPSTCNRPWFGFVWRRRMLNSLRNLRSGSSVGANVPIPAMWSTIFANYNVHMGQRSRISQQQLWVFLAFINSRAVQFWRLACNLASESWGKQTCRIMCIG
jgi:hypothetical protein